MSNANRKQERERERERRALTAIQPDNSRHAAGQTSRLLIALPFDDCMRHNKP